MEADGEYSQKGTINLRPVNVNGKQGVFMALLWNETYTKGPFINYVDKQGGGGGLPNVYSTI